MIMALNQILLLTYLLTSDDSSPCFILSPRYWF